MTIQSEPIGELPTDLEWKLSKKGNPYTNTDLWNIAVFRRGKRKKDGTYNWSYRTQRRSPTTDPTATVAPYSVLYHTMDEAKEAALQSIINLEERLILHD
jgi:hypothetical protein